MFCRKCGANIPDDSIFCQKCGAGTDIEDALSEKMNNIVQDQCNTESSDTGFKKLKSAKSKRILILIIVFAVVACITISEILVNLPQKGTENFNKYFGVNISDSQYNYLVNDRVSFFGFIAYELIGGGKYEALSNIERNTGVRIDIEDLNEFKDLKITLP